MPVQQLENTEAVNPRTMEEAQALVKHVESLFMPWNVEALVGGFTPDCIIRFGDLPEFGGHDALRRFFTARSERQRNYRLTKTLRGLMGDTICNSWEGAWEDAATGQAMTGFGCEIWQMRGGRIAVWEGAFNAGPVGGQGSMQSLLT